MRSHEQQLVELALKEDIGTGDVTASYFIPENAEAIAYVLVKENGIIAGYDIAHEVLAQIDASIQCEILKEEGSSISAHTRVLKLTGNARNLLTAERTVLNFLQRLSGIASKTNSYVQLIKHTQAILLDTRKTTPGWRSLEKKAVRIGGGANHRMGLYDRAMIKDNHLVAERDLPTLQKAIQQLKSEQPNVEIELEADTLDQVRSFLTLDHVDYILLDNMSLEELREAVKLRGNSQIKLEASGGVTHHTIAGIAETGVDFISVGALTHSAVSLDISLEFAPLSS